VHHAEFISVYDTSHDGKGPHADTRANSRAADGIATWRQRRAGEFKLATGAPATIAQHRRSFARPAGPSQAAPMSAIAIDVALGLTVALTGLLAVTLIKVIRQKPNWSKLPDSAAGSAESDLGGRIENFGKELRESARNRALVWRRTKVRRGDVRAEYRNRRIRAWRKLLARAGITVYGGITISFASLIVAVPSAPHVPPQGAGFMAVVGAFGVLLAAIPVFSGSSAALGDLVKRLRRPKQPPADFSPPVSAKVTGYCDRLAQDVREEAQFVAACERRWAELITAADVATVWSRLVSDPAAAAREARPALSRRARAVRGAQVLLVAGIFYAVAKVDEARLPAGRYWSALAIIGSVVLVYLALVNVQNAWKHRDNLRRRIGKLASSFRENLRGIPWPRLRLPWPRLRLPRPRLRLPGRTRGGAATNAPANAPPAPATGGSGPSGTPLRERRLTVPNLPPRPVSAASAAPAEDRPMVLDALRLGWYMAEVRGRNRLDPPPGAQAAILDNRGHALPLRAERTAAELRIEAQQVLGTLAVRLQVDHNSAAGSSYSAAVDQKAAALASAPSPDALAGLWDALAELIYIFDASIQDTLSARSETQAAAYQLGRGLAEAYWALAPAAPCDPLTPDCWGFLLGVQRCDELTRLAGRLGAYFSPYCLPAVARTVHRWQSIASDPERREIAYGQLYRQIRRWYDLLILTQDPASLIKPYGLGTSWRVSRRALRALWVQVLTAAISLALVAAAITFAVGGFSSAFVQAAAGAAGVAGLTTAIAQAWLKNSADQLLPRLRQDAYTDLITAAIMEAPR
jgi:hypothetical protein